MRVFDTTVEVRPVRARLCLQLSSHCLGTGVIKISSIRFDSRHVFQITAPATLENILALSAQILLHTG